MSLAQTRETGLHATAVIFGEDGVLILGPSGAGKSALALALLSRARATNRFAALVGDDRVWARRAAGRLVARGAGATAGLIERRMAGLVRVDCESAAVVRLVVELSGPDRDWPRLPEEPEVLTICGIKTPRLALSSRQSAADQAVAIEERLSYQTNGGAEGKGISLQQCAALHKNGKVADPLRHEGRRRREPVD